MSEDFLYKYALISLIFIIIIIPLFIVIFHLSGVI